MLMTSISPPRESFTIILGHEKQFLTPKELSLWGREVDAEVPTPGVQTLCDCILMMMGGGFLFIVRLPSTRHLEALGRHDLTEFSQHPAS